MGGLSVAQGLVQYYDSWQNSSEDVASTVRSLEELTKILRVVRTTISGQRTVPQTKSTVLESIDSCERGIRALEKKLQKIKASPTPDGSVQDGLRDKVRAQARRVLYPFKESTLAKLRELISELRDNLTLALNIMQM